MKKNFVFVAAMLALTAFTIGVVSITQQLSAQTMPPETTKPKSDEKPDKPKITDEMRDKMEREFDKAIEEFEEGEKPAFVELGIPEWWMNPPEFENHVVFGCGVAIFEGLEELQEAKDNAELNARFDIDAKLSGRLDTLNDRNNIEIYGADCLQACDLRVFKSEIVKHKGRYAYYVMLTYSLFNHALKDMDPDDVNKVKETLDFMQEYGAFNREKVDPKYILELSRKSEDNRCRIIKDPVYELTTEYSYKPKPQLDGRRSFESQCISLAIDFFSKKLRKIIHEVLLDFTAKTGLEELHKNFYKVFTEDEFRKYLRIENIIVLKTLNESWESENEKIIIKLDHNKILRICLDFLKENNVELNGNDTCALRDMLVDAIKSANK